MGNKVSFISELLPLPDTPVTTINRPNGKSTFIFLRLFPVAPFKVKSPDLALRRSFGVLISFFPDKYCPVSEFFTLSNFFGTPA